MVAPKFRAWVSAKMYNEPLIHDGTVYLDWQDFEDGRTYEDAILMQSTGLFDKNGIEIFEGDIIEYYSRDKPQEKRRFGVIFNDEAFRSDVSGIMLSFFCKVFFATEVIGNIYENPELLEEAE